MGLQITRRILAGSSGWVYRHPATISLLVLGAATGWYWVQPDVIPLNDGLGFEGAYFYRAVAEDFYRAVWMQGINPYSIQRILPFGLLHVVFRLLHLPFTPAAMVHFFVAYNLGLGILLVCYWCRLSQRLQLGLGACWTGYIGLVFNFATLKYDLYVPFTYDRTALVVGVASLYYHLKGQRMALLLTALVSLVVWPTALYCNMLLLLLPADLQVPRAGNRILSLWWAGLVALGFGGLCIVVLYVRQLSVGNTVAPTEEHLLPLSISIAVAYLGLTQYGVARLLLPKLSQVPALCRQVLRPDTRLLAVLVLVGAYLLLTRVVASEADPHLNVPTFLVNVVYGAVTRPGQFIVAHSAYYGLPVILALLWWRPLLRTLRQVGPGVGALFALLLLLAVNCETRQLANLLPVLVLLTALLVQHHSVTPVRVAAVAVLFLLYSRVWLRINSFDPAWGQPYDTYPQAPTYGAEYAWNSPYQAYWANIGPWASNQFLLLQGFGLLLILLLVRVLYRPIHNHSQKLFSFA